MAYCRPKQRKWLKHKKVNTTKCDKRQLAMNLHYEMKRAGNNLSLKTMGAAS